MRLLVFGLSVFLDVGLLGHSAGVRADEKKKEAKSDQAKSDPAKEFAALDKEFQDARQTFIKAYREAKTPEERQQIVKDKQPKVPEYADRFMKLAETYPDSPAAIQALGWLVGNARGTEAGNKALTKLKEKLPAIDDLDQLAKTLPHVPAFGFADQPRKIPEKPTNNIIHPQAVPVLMWVCSATFRSAGIPEQEKAYNSTVDLLLERLAERPALAPLAGYLPQDTNPEWAANNLRKMM